MKTFLAFVLIVGSLLLSTMSTAEEVYSPFDSQLVTPSAGVDVLVCV